MAGKVWPERPKSLSERGYRKYMAKTKEITIGVQKFTLQSVSPSWYYDFNDECGNTGGRRKSTKYMDGMSVTVWFRRRSQGAGDVLL